MVISNIGIICQASLTPKLLTKGRYILFTHTYIFKHSKQSSFHIISSIHSPFYSETHRLSSSVHKHAPIWTPHFNTFRVYQENHICWCDCWVLIVVNTGCSGLWQLKPRLYCADLEAMISTREREKDWGGWQYALITSWQHGSNFSEVVMIGKKLAMFR